MFRYAPLQVCVANIAPPVPLKKVTKRKLYKYMGLCRRMCGTTFFAFCLSRVIMQDAVSKRFFRQNIDRWRRMVYNENNRNLSGFEF